MSSLFSNRINNTPITLRMSAYRTLLLISTLLAAGWTQGILPAIAQTSPAPGTEILNQATGSFNADEDPAGTTPTIVESNIVKVTVSEVAGITVTASGSSDDGEINPEDVITFDFTITNVGNDPTQFFIPGAPSAVTNGSAGTLQIIAYDPDGIGTEATSQAISIDIPIAGMSTGEVSALDLPDGAIPPGGTVTVRVPVTVDSAAIAGSVVSVTLGETTPDSGGSTQNQPYVADTADVQTQDNLNADPADSPLTAATETEAAGVPANGVREASARQESGAIVSAPHVLLVKRITAINNNTQNPNDNTALNTILNDGVADSPDDHSSWPINYLIGALDGGSIKPISNEPADAVEYSIYFLSAGGAEAQNVLLCDRIPQSTSFLPNAYASLPRAEPTTQPSQLGIALDFNGSEFALTGVDDGDAGYYFPPTVEPSTQFPNINCGGPNVHGAVVVNVGNLPAATSAGNPLNAFGVLRLQVSVD